MALLLVALILLTGTVFAQLSNPYCANCHESAGNTCNWDDQYDDNRDINFTSYTCQCFLNYLASRDNKNCVALSSLCGGEIDRCLTLMNTLNTCTSNGRCQCTQGYRLVILNDGNYYCRPMTCDDEEIYCRTVDPSTGSRTQNSCNVLPQLGYAVCSCVDTWAVYGGACVATCTDCSSDSGVNKCYIDTNGNNFCVCGAGYQQTSSTECDQTDVCNRNECNTDASKFNTCVAGIGQAYTCQCAPGFQNNNDGQYGETCDIPSLCNSNECRSNENGNNDCTDNRDGTYTCDCGGTGWRDTFDFQACIPPGLSCNDDQCKTSLNPSNRCNDQRDGTYTCSCASSWSNTQGTCVAPTLCNSNECSQSGNPNNRCTDNRDGTYVCSCLQAGWTLTYTNGKQGCLDPRTTTCKNNECSVSQNSANKCLPNLDGTYTCSCHTPWTTSVDLQLCIAPPQMCLYNECSSLEAQLNQCVDNGQGAYTCLCRAPGWTTPSNQRSCNPPASRCQSDECTTSANANNICTDNFDGTYNCQCAKGWTLTTPSVGRPACAAPPPQCRSSSQCRTDIPGNACQDNGDGTQTCYCNAPGWTLTADRSTCQAPPVQCLSGQCNVNVPRSNNRCTDNKDGTYKCLCGPLFITTADGLNCIAPVLCQDNECYQGNSSNICTDNSDGTYQCTCKAPWVAAPGNPPKSCIAPNPCLSYPCKQTVFGNQCQNYPDGTYRCTCGASGYLSFNNSLLCDRDPCIGQCAQVGTRNTCSTTGLGLFQCQCNGGWLLAPNRSSCFSPCTPNPCGIPTRGARCDVLPQDFACTCLPGFALSDDLQSCLGCTTAQELLCGVQNGNGCLRGALTSSPYRCNCTGQWMPSADQSRCVTPTPTHTPTFSPITHTPTLAPTFPTPPPTRTPRPTLAPTTPRPTTTTPTFSPTHTSAPTPFTRPYSTAPPLKEVTPGYLRPSSFLGWTTVRRTAGERVLDVDPTLDRACDTKFPGSKAAYISQVTNRLILNLPTYANLSAQVVAGVGRGVSFYLKCDTPNLNCLDLSDASRRCVAPLPSSPSSSSSSSSSSIPTPSFTLTPALNRWPLTADELSGDCGAATVAAICVTSASCWARCGAFTPSDSCSCDTPCLNRGDCCPDYQPLCVDPASSCFENCGSRAETCWCDNYCVRAGDCCPDLMTVCGVSENM